MSSKVLIVPFIHLGEEKEQQNNPDVVQPDALVEQHEYESRVVFKVDTAFANPKVKIPFRANLPYRFMKYTKNLFFSARAESLYTAGFDLYVTHSLRYFTATDLTPPTIVAETEEFNNYIELTYQNYDDFICALIIDTFYTVHTYLLNCKRSDEQDIDGFTKIDILSSSPELNIAEGSLYAFYLTYPIKILPADFYVKFSYREGDGYTVELKASVDGSLDKRILL